MAVPKKRRITRRLLNKGAQFLRLYSSINSLSSSRLRLAGVGKTLVTSAPLFTSQLLLTLQTIVPTKHRLFDQPMFALPSSNKAVAPLKRTLNQRLATINLSWYVTPTRLRKGRAELLPYSGDTPLNRAHLTFLLKQSFFAIQVPHTWGPQRFYLMQEFSIRPTYVTWFPATVKVGCMLRPFSGAVYPLWSTNLKRPFGPTLKMLWTYAKTNPNEGYWIYCMWLNVKKRWRRWLVFPYTYMWKRNIFKRSKVLNDIKLNLDIHMHFFVYRRLGIFCKTLILALPLIKPLRSHGFLTLIAKQLVGLKYFKKK